MGGRGTLYVSLATLERQPTPPPSPLRPPLFGVSWVFCILIEASWIEVLDAAFVGSQDTALELFTGSSSKCVP